MSGDTRGMSRHIKDALVTVLSGIQYQGEDAFVGVLDNTSDAFEGYPSVRLLPDKLMSEPADNADNDHAVSFMAIVYWPLQDPMNIEADLYNQMLDITDLITDTLETADYNDQLSDVDPVILDWKMVIKGAYWMAGETKSGNALRLIVNIEVNYSKDLT